MFTFSAASAAPRPADPLEAPKMLDPGPKMELLLEASPKSIKEELLPDCVEPPSQRDSTATGPSALNATIKLSFPVKHC